MADSRPTSQEMQDQVFEAIPATGEIRYRDLHTKLQMSGQGQSLAFFRALKKAGLIKTRVVANADGSVDHLVTRA